jgi:hypothetical protein
MAASGGEVLDRSAAAVLERQSHEFWQGSDPAALAFARQDEAARQHVAVADVPALWQEKRG